MDQNVLDSFIVKCLHTVEASYENTKKKKKIRFTIYAES